MRYAPKTTAFFSLLLLCLGRIVLAQEHELKGKVVSREDKPVDYVHVRLSKNDTSVAGQVLTDSLGRFSMKVPEGSYSFALERFGRPLLKKEISLFGDLDLGALKIDGSVEIEAVAVTAIKSLTRESVDKTSIEVKGQQVFEGDNVIAILGKIQGVAVMDNKISYDGVEVTSVRINGRRMGFGSRRELMGYLNGLDNKAVKKLEIVHQSAKSSASNAGKTLNIVLDEPLLDGLSLNPTLRYSQGIRSEKGLTLFSQAKKGKLSSDIFFMYSLDRSLRDESATVLYRNTNERQEQHNELAGESRPLSLDAGVQYDFNPSTYIGVSYKYYAPNIDDATASRVQLYKNGVRDSVFDHRTSLATNGGYHTASLYFSRKLDTLGQNIRLELNYNRYGTANEQLLTGTAGGADLGGFRSKTDRKTDLPNASLDYDRKIFGGTDLSAGLLYYALDDAQDRTLIPGGKSPLFAFSENIFAQYVSVLGSNKLFSYQIGLRGEATSNAFNSYYDLFPSIALRKDFNKLGVRLSYDRSISRPLGFMLNPHPVYLNQYLAWVGNPQLLPRMVHLLSSALSYKSWRLSANYYNYANDMVRLQTLDGSDDRLVVERFVNIDGKNTTDLTLSHNFRRKSISITPMVYYSIMDFKMDGTSGRIRNYFSYFSLSSSYNVTKTDRIDAAFRYYFENKLLYTTSEPRHSFDLTYNKSLMDRKLNLQVFVKDLFRGGRIKSRDVLPYVERSMDAYRDSRRAGLSIRYAFNFGESVDVDGTKNNVNRR